MPLKVEDRVLPSLSNTKLLVSSFGGFFQFKGGFHPGKEVQVPSVTRFNSGYYIKPYSGDLWT